MYSSFYDSYELYDFKIDKESHSFNINHVNIKDGKGPQVF